MTETKRRYRKRERARKEAETRRRIVESVVDLHRTVGPANTTITEVADRAGVGRMTVYNHFPTEADLIEACSSHWSRLNPLPDPGQWLATADPDERLLLGLTELYGWYERTEDMMGKILRDAPIVPALGDLMEDRWWALVDRMCQILTRGRRLRGRRKTQTEAAIRVALDFSTWRTLTDTGLDSDSAAEVASDFLPAA
jgi:AcrR family transcriptional regulator